MCYSIMLLNTDLHLADIESKMTRSQFVKNTMSTIKHAAIDSAPDSFERASILPGKNSSLNPTEENPMFIEEEQEQRLKRQEPEAEGHKSAGWGTPQQGAAGRRGRGP